MFSLTLKRLIGASIAAPALIFAAAPAAAADTVEVSYLPPIIGIEMLYRGMGYADAEGNFISLAGGHITSATVLVDFTVADGVDASGFHMDMFVPVAGAVSQYFAVEGSDLIQVSPNHYTYSLTTTNYNGEIFDSRFALSTYAFDGDGNPISLPALVDAKTGFYFTTDVLAAVPEPSEAVLLASGLLFVAPLVARRRNKR